MADNTTDALRPLFITGASALIQVVDPSGATHMLGYCVNVNCRFDSPNTNIDVLGMYEPIAVVPTASSVFGGFSIVRYLSPPTWTQNLALNLNTKGGSLQNIDLGDQLEPANFLKYPYFTLRLFQNQSQTTTDSNGVLKTSIQPVQFEKIVDCRIINKVFSLNKKAFVVDGYQFMGRLSTDTESTYPSGIASADNGCSHTQWQD